MNYTRFCQSCGMPLDKPALLGTEKDGSKNHKYCCYCYQNGAFINPGMTLDEMKILVQAEMKKKNIGDSVINMALKILPGLKRWNAEPVK